LQQVLYSKGGGGGNDGLKTTRLSVLLNSALGIVAKNSGAAIDFDAIPENAVDVGTTLKFLFSNKTASLRNILQEEAVIAADILFRQASRKIFSNIINNLPRPPFFNQFLPRPETIPVLFLLPELNGFKSISSFTPASKIIEIASPKLSREEELYAISLTDLVTQTFGSDVASIITGESTLNIRSVSRVLLSVISNGKFSPPLEILNSIPDNISSNVFKFLVGDINNSEENKQNIENIRDSLLNLNQQEVETFQNFTFSVSRDVVDKLLERLQKLE
jgi:hypothetical protein